MEKHSASTKEQRQRPVKLRCAVKNYPWGILGHYSQVARLFSLNSGSRIDPKTPYAEFWIGTHVSGPAFVDPTPTASLSLKSWISQDPTVLGDKVCNKWGGDLPFLLKVLSIEKALSIQAHPDQEGARSLHKLQPSIYKDANHKPEMAVAHTDFEALCGFISLKTVSSSLAANRRLCKLVECLAPKIPSEVVNRWNLVMAIVFLELELKGILCNVPEIVHLVGSNDVKQILSLNERDGSEKLRAAIESVFTCIMSLSKDTICETISKMKRRMNLEKKKRQLTDKERLMLRLESQYPSDVGVIASFLLNHVKLERGEALYLGPNEPHAYICGECVECMATSDNVVRAGLTSKLRDIPTLISMLSYKQGFPEIIRGVPVNLYTKRYLPPFDEFELDRCILPEAASVVFPSVQGPSLFLVIAGRGTIKAGFSEKESIKEGEAIFVPAYTEISVAAESTELQVYRAGVNSRFLTAL